MIMDGLIISREFVFVKLNFIYFFVIIKVKERLIKLSPFFLTRKGVAGRGSPPAAG